MVRETFSWTKSNPVVPILDSNGFSGTVGSLHFTFSSMVSNIDITAVLLLDLLQPFQRQKVKGLAKKNEDEKV